MKKTQFGNLTFTRSVDNFSVPLLVGLASGHNDDDGDYIDDDDNDGDDDNGDGDDDDDDDDDVDDDDGNDLTGDHNVLSEVHTTRISELLVNVFAPVAYLLQESCVKDRQRECQNEMSACSKQDRQ